MAWFALIYDVVDDYVSSRVPFREEHLGNARAAVERGELVLAGALGDPPRQSMLIFRVADASIVDEFARNDPYVKAGIVTRWRVEPWAVAVGSWPGE